MHFSVRKPCLLQVIAKRGYSTQVGYKTSDSTNVTVTNSSKNIRLVSVNEDSFISRVTYSFKAGSRYEMHDTLGMTHVLRKAVGLSNLKQFPFNIHRVTDFNGISLYASVDREVFSVTVEANPDKLEVALEYLNDVATKPAFKPWEIEDNRNRIKQDLALLTPQEKILDSLHKVAYRNGLGNPLFIDPSRISKFNNEHCLQFFNEHFTTKRLQITSSGVTSKELDQLTPAIELGDEVGPQASKPVYYGGEVRIGDYKDHVTYVAIAGPTPGYSAKDYLPYAVLQYVYGNGPAIKYGDSQAILNQALAKTGVTGAVTGISASYPDSGLLGFLYVADSADVSKGYDSVLNAFLKSDITDKDVSRAKALLKTALLNSTGTSGIVDFLARQAGASSIITPTQLASGVDAITTNDVKQASKKLLENKLSAVVYGDVGVLPYLDTIKK